jgi:hypothetical protein
VSSAAISTGCMSNAMKEHAQEHATPRLIVEIHNKINGVWRRRRDSLLDVRKPNNYMKLKLTNPNMCAKHVCKCGREICKYETYYETV